MEAVEVVARLLCTDSLHLMLFASIVGVPVALAFIAIVWNLITGE
jgi:hypothetical protein